MTAITADFLETSSWRKHWPWVLAALLVHVGLASLLTLFESTTTTAPEIMSVSLLPMSPPAPLPPAPTPKPQPVVKKSEPKSTVQPKPAVTTSETAISQAQVPVAAAQAAASTSTAAPSGADKPVAEAHFVPAHDAAYLNNPKPVHPPMSRRLGEYGKVVLEVYILANGTPSKVQVKKSSGYFRLDEAALDAVRRWTFVPAKRGSEAVASSYDVPIIFVPPEK